MILNTTFIVVKYDEVPNYHSTFTTLAIYKPISIIHFRLYYKIELKEKIILKVDILRIKYPEIKLNYKLSLISAEVVRIIWYFEIIKAYLFKW